MNLILIIMLALGGYWLITAHVGGAYWPAAIAIRKRMPKPPTSTERIANFLGHRIAPYIVIDDPAQYNQLRDALKNIGSNESPELFKAKAVCKAGLIAIASACLMLLVSALIGVITFITIFVALYQQEMKRLDKQLAERRKIIERELPQFASTICQSLRSTRDVESILASYRKVCGPTLAGEIEHTLNDMLTGSPERALRALQSRVNSPQLSQLVRGLISVLHGEEQSLYFQILSTEFLKAQDEEVSRELEKRPEKLYPNLGLLFGCLLFMLTVAIGFYIKQQLAAF